MEIDIFFAVFECDIEDMIEAESTSIREFMNGILDFSREEGNGFLMRVIMTKNGFVDKVVGGM